MEKKRRRRRNKRRKVVHNGWEGDEGGRGQKQEEK
jgi:hypothetical protein